MVIAKDKDNSRHKMNAAFLTGIRTLEIREVPAPRLQNNDEVLLRVVKVGVCGSDLHYYQQGRIGNQIISYPFIIGHECSAVVEETGKEVSHLEPGDAVAVDPAISCGKCAQCRAGRPHTCLNLRFLGCPGQKPGCLAEHIVMPARNCIKLPEGVSLEQGALAEPLSIGIYALEFLRHRLPRSIAILGCGPIGLSVLLAAKASGAADIYATDKIAARLQAAKTSGAKWAGNPEQTDVVKEILDRSSSLEAVFECCGDQEAIDQALELLTPGGTLLILGIPEEERLYFNAHSLRRKEINIQNVRRQNHCTSRALELIADESIDVDFMGTHTFSLEKAQDAFELVSNYGDGVIKAMISLS
jgi:L-iditol 2-dehydrogenase